MGQRIGALSIALLAGCGETAERKTVTEVDPSGRVCVQDERMFARCPVTWRLRDPCGLLSSAASLEGAVFAGACPPDTTLADGATNGAIVRQIVDADQALEPIDQLSKQPHGFAFVVRDASCRVIAHGCTEADLARDTDVRTEIGNWTASDSCAPGTSGQCASELACNDGRCGPDTGCSLALVASGALPIAAGARFGGPRLVATSDAFMLAYREHISDGIDLHLIRIDDTGDIRRTTRHVVSCPAISDSGVGAAFANGQGIAVSSLGSCSDGARTSVLSFDPQAAVGAWSTLHEPSFPELGATSHSVAPTVTPGEYYFAYRAEQPSGPVAQLGILSGTVFKPGVPIQNLFDSASARFVSIAASPAILAVVGSLASEQALRLQIFGTSAGAPPMMDRLISADAAWASVFAWDQSVALLHADGAAALLKVATSSGELLPGPTFFSAVPLLSGDVTRLRDHVLLATGMQSGIGVYRFGGAMGGFGRDADDTSRKLLYGDLSGVSLSGFAGQGVAIAAARQRVAVAWLDSEPTSSSPGGFALLRCVE